jgi:hypothetical protein
MAVADFACGRNGWRRSLLMSSAGFLSVRLHWQACSGQVRRATLSLRRPDVAPLLVGRSPEEAAERVRSLHAVCGSAHRLAALRAIEDARTRDPGRDPERARAAAAESRHAEHGALVEMALEHLVRLYIDWPDALGLAVQPAVVLGLRRRVRGVPDLISHEDFDTLRRQGGALVAAASAVPGIGPRLQRRVRKTIACLMAVKREQSQPAKIRKWVTPLPAPDRAPAAGGTTAEMGAACGEGRAFTARGELVHRVGIGRDGAGLEVVAAWTIDAPTDRIFVDGGPVAEALLGLQADGAEALRRQAALVVLSFDPCFECRIEICEDGKDDARDVAGAGDPGNP